METINELQPLKYLQQIINRAGFYSGKSRLLITYEGEFEGFYGKASEDWEQQAVIQLKEIKNSNDEIMIPEIKVIGLRNESIEQVARKVVIIYERWKINSQ